MPTLNTTHRCDQCQAQAYVVTTLTSGGMLLWCRHHWIENRDALEPLVVDLIDETDRLHKAIEDDKHTVG